MDHGGTAGVLGQVILRPTLVMPAGTFVLLETMTFHAGGANVFERTNFRLHLHIRHEEGMSSSDEVPEVDHGGTASVLGQVILAPHL